MATAELGILDGEILIEGLVAVRESSLLKVNREDLNLSFSFVLLPCLTERNCS